MGNDLFVPDGKRGRGLHTSYALLGIRSAGGSRRTGDRLGVVPLGSSLAIAGATSQNSVHRKP